MSVPPHVLAASLAAYGLHDSAVQVAHLTGDSLLDEDVDPGADADRRLVFDTDDIRIDVTIRLLPGKRQVGVELSQPDFESLVVLQPPSHAALPLSAAGAHAELEPGLTSLLVRGAGRAAIRTAWVVF